jgi:hypothetical protein
MSDHLFALTSDQVAVTSDDCYTPRWVFDAMGLHFDLDAAAPVGGPWHVPCDRYYTAAEDGLTSPWDGVVWCNPPYSNFRPWAAKWAAHDRGALMGHYTPGTAWTPLVLSNADAVAFLTVEFIRPDGGTIRPRAGLFVAFRGVGHGPAQRLAAADRFGSVLYGAAAA